MRLVVWVAIHRRWKERFPEMRRVMHKADVQGYGDTKNIEVGFGEGHSVAPRTRAPLQRCIHTTWPCFDEAADRPSRHDTARSLNT